ncbi:MAG: glycosylhydrolase-like jelly roll fold domain-containing protein, partial [Promethearchaeota archaeon]
RCQYILQRGKIVSNIGIFYNVFNYCDSVLRNEELVGGHLDEYDAPIAKNQFDGCIKKKKKWTFEDKWTYSLQELSSDLISNGFYYCHINEESLIRGKIKNKKITIGTAKVEVLIFPNIESISLKMAEKLEEISKSGISIIFLNKIPVKQNGYLNYKENDLKILKIMNSIIEEKTGILITEIKRISRFIINDLKIRPGILYRKPQSSIQYIHKRMKNSDVYFLRNSANTPKRVIASFFHSDKLPFILDPWTGNSYQAIKYKINEDSIELDMNFSAYGSKIIEFRQGIEESHVKEDPEKLERINNDIFKYIKSTDLSPIYLEKWSLKTEIRKNNGEKIPIVMELDELKDWRKISKLKYCSSRGYYSSKIVLNENYFKPNLKLILSLGRVHDVAVIKINGFKAAPLIVYPYELDASKLLKEGENIIEIEIIPTLRNRLIGYGKKGGKNWKNHKKKKEFMPSGLIGPVIIQIYERIKI